MENKKNMITVTRLKPKSNKKTPSNNIELQATASQKRKNDKEESFTTGQMVQWLWYKIEADKKSFSEPQKTREFIEANRKKILIGCDKKQQEEVNAQIDHLIDKFENRLKLGVKTIGDFWIDKYDSVQRKKVDLQEELKILHKKMEETQAQLSEMDLRERQCLIGIEQEKEMKEKFEGICFDEKESTYKIKNRSEEVVSKKLQQFNETSGNELEMDNL